MDVVDKAKRSEIMGKIRSTDTKLELSVRSALHRKGLRFRLYYDIPGKPDIVFVKSRVVVFIDSCFWHGCPDHFRMPNTHRRYWAKKIADNIKRDDKVSALCLELGWKVLRFWEHELRNDFDLCIERMRDEVRKGSRSGLNPC